MPLPKKSWVKKWSGEAVRTFASDRVNPITVSNPFYARKFLEDARTIARQKMVLPGSSARNRIQIQRGIEKNQFKYRSKVIFWSMKNALRAIDIPLARRREVMVDLLRYADLLVFALPSSMRKVRDNDQFTQMELKQKRFAQEKIQDAIDQLYRVLDAKIGLKKRRQLIHYFSLLYEGGQTYRQAVEAQLRDPEE